MTKSSRRSKQYRVWRRGSGKSQRNAVEQIKRIDEKLKDKIFDEINKDVVKDDFSEKIKERMDRDYQEVLRLQETSRISSEALLEQIGALVGDINNLRGNIDVIDMQLVSIIQSGAGSDHDWVDIDGVFIDAELADPLVGDGPYASGIDPESIELRINGVLVGNPLDELVLVGVSSNPDLGDTSLKLQYRPRLDLLYFVNQFEIKFRDYADNEGVVTGDFSCGE